MSYSSQGPRDLVKPEFSRGRVFPRSLAYAVHRIDLLYAPPLRHVPYGCITAATQPAVSLGPCEEANRGPRRGHSVTTPGCGPASFSPTWTHPLWPDWATAWCPRTTLWRPRPARALCPSRGPAAWPPWPARRPSRSPPGALSRAWAGTRAAAPRPGSSARGARWGSDPGALRGGNPLA